MACYHKCRNTEIRRENPRENEVGGTKPLTWRRSEAALATLGNQGRLLLPLTVGPTLAECQQLRVSINGGLSAK